MNNAELPVYQWHIARTLQNIIFHNYEGWNSVSDVLHGDRRPSCTRPLSLKRFASFDSNSRSIKRLGVFPLFHRSDASASQGYHPASSWPAHLYTSVVQRFEPIRTPTQTTLILRPPRLPLQKYILANKLVVKKECVASEEQNVLTSVMKKTNIQLQFTSIICMCEVENSAPK